MSTYSHTTCDACGARYKIAPENIGRLLRCKKCGNEFETREVVAAILAPPSVPTPPPAPPVPERKPEPPTVVMVPVMQNENVWNRNRGCADLLLFSPLVLVLIVPAALLLKAVLNWLNWLFPNIFNRRCADLLLHTPGVLPLVLVLVPLTVLLLKAVLSRLFRNTRA